MRRKHSKYIHSIGSSVFGDIEIKDTLDAMIIKNRKTEKKLVYPIPNSFKQRKSFVKEGIRLLKNKNPTIRCPKCGSYNTDTWKHGGHRYYICYKCHHEWKGRHGIDNPVLETIGAGMLTGIGVGAGFMAVRQVAKKMGIKGNPSNLIIKCAWCGKSLGEKPPYKDKHITHGICERCQMKYFGKKNPREYIIGEKVFYKKPGRPMDASIIVNRLKNKSTGKIVAYMVKNGDVIKPSEIKRAFNPLTKVHPLAIQAKKKYLEDVKAGHKGGSEYWAGAAGTGYLMSNPEGKCPKCGRFGEMYSGKHRPQGKKKWYRMYWCGKCKHRFLVPI